MNSLMRTCIGRVRYEAEKTPAIVDLSAMGLWFVLDRLLRCVADLRGTDRMEAGEDILTQVDVARSVRLVEGFEGEVSLGRRCYVGLNCRE